MISLGIDIGGTGCRCIAFSDNGLQVAAAYEEYPNPPGKTSLEPLVLRGSLFAVIRACVLQLPNPKLVAAVTVSSFGESFVAVDRTGEPLGDIIMYFANSESRDFDRLVSAVGPERFMEITCVKPDASYSLAKMLHTQNTAPRPVHMFLLIAGYAAFCLSGEAVCDYSLACRTILFDVRRLCWSRELLDAAGISEAMLPTVLPTGAVVGTLLADVASELGLSPDVKVVIGSHDQIVSAMGAGVHQVGQGVDTTGTSECITPLFADIPADMEFIRRNYACVPYPDGLGYVTYAYNISGGAVVKWYRDTLAAHLREQAKAEGCSIYDLLNRVCPESPTELIVLPYFQGMGGTPDIETGCRGTFSGVSMSTTLPDVYRAILEGLTFEMAYNMQQLRRFDAAPTTLYACGGGARSRKWLQIKADILGCDIIPSLVEETGALGSAILGFAAVTGETDRMGLARHFVRSGDVISPNPANQAVYREKFTQFQELRAHALLAAQRQKQFV